MPAQSEISDSSFDPSSGTFSAIDLTLSYTSILIGYNWRVYKDPCGSDHYPVIMKNTINWKLRTTNNFQIPTIKLKKKRNKLAILQKTIPYYTNPLETNTYQGKPIIHVTLIIMANKIILKTIISLKSN